MVRVPEATNNFFAPEMAKNSPSKTRTSKIAYCSISLLPSSARCPSRCKSIFISLHRGCLRAQAFSQQKLRPVLAHDFTEVVPEPIRDIAGLVESARHRCDMELSYHFLSRRGCSIASEREDSRFKLWQFSASFLRQAMSFAAAILALP